MRFRSVWVMPTSWSAQMPAKSGLAASSAATMSAAAAAVAGVRGAQLGGEDPPVLRVVLRRIDLAGGRRGEPAVHHVPFQAGPAGVVAEQRDGRPGLAQRLAVRGHDLRRGVLEPVQDPHDAGADVVGARVPGGARVPAEPEEVVAFRQGQVQAAGDGGEHLLGRVRPALLLDPAVVVG